MQHCRSWQRSQGSPGGWNGAVQATSTLASGRRGHHHCRAKAHGCGTLRILVEEQARPCQLLPPAGCHHPRSPWMRDVQTPFGALASVSEASQRRVHVGCRLRSGPALMPTTLCHVIEHWNVRQHHGCRPKGEHQTCCQQRLSCKALTPGHAPVVYELVNGKHGGYLMPRWSLPRHAPAPAWLACAHQAGALGNCRLHSADQSINGSLQRPRPTPASVGERWRVWHSVPHRFKPGHGCKRCLTEI